MGETTSRTAKQHPALSIIIKNKLITYVRPAKIGTELFTLQAYNFVVFFSN